MPLSTFPFAKLPPEIRRIIWKLALAGPNQVHFDGRDITWVSIHPVRHACRESRQLCNDDKDKLQVGSVTLATNFKRDIFLFTRSSLLPVHNLTIFERLERVIIPLQSGLQFLLQSNSHLRELWVTFSDQDFNPAPADTFRRHCPLHLCEELPSGYREPCRPGCKSCRKCSSDHDRQKKICPACLWALELDFAFGTFPITCYHLLIDRKLPIFPTKQQIVDSGNPVFKWVRAEPLEEPDPHECDFNADQCQCRLAVLDCSTRETVCRHY